jgi:nucleotide-binding universal stress UspA family protein
VPLFPRTLVPLTLTESDAGLLRYAAGLVGMGLTTDVLFAHAAPPDLAAGDLARRRADLEAAVAAAFLPPVGVRTTFEVGAGPRVDWLIEAAIAFKADATVLGHRAARAGTRSLAHRLTLIAPCSVWLVPEGAPPQIRRVLAPVDFSDHSADGLGAATAVARAAGLDRCLALHVAFDPSTVRYHEHVVAAREDERAACARFLEGVDRHGVAVEPVFEESPQVAKTVLRVSAARGADLIVLSTRGRSRAVSILVGSVTAAVMAESPVPVLAVKHAGARMNLFQILTDRRLWAQSGPKTN